RRPCDAPARDWDSALPRALCDTGASGIPPRVRRIDVPEFRERRAAPGDGFRSCWHLSADRVEIRAVARHALDAARNRRRRLADRSGAVRAVVGLSQSCGALIALLGAAFLLFPYL